ncbi:MAG: FTR1 family protein [Cardiobacteriaceae bacterium]|nr:FTR1 family protein [Cardiobacteriaceae bacterium]
MKMTILAKHYLHKFSLIIALLLLSGTALAAVNISPLFINLSDAMEAVKQNDSTKAIPHLEALQRDFIALEQHLSPAGSTVSDALEQALATPSEANLETLSKALYAFEKEQNPVDYVEKRKTFAKRVMPVYEQLDKAVTAHDMDEVQALYKRFNSTWTVNEKVVRETSLGHYGQIETAMTFLRVAMLADPPNYPEMQKQSQALGAALSDFKAGNVLQAQSISGAPETLPDGIALLEKSLSDLKAGNNSDASQKIAVFIQQWPIFEGDVQTRDGALYTRVESELPVILSKGNTPENIAQLQTLIADLNAIDISANYGILDAALVLLREGLEALLVVMALIAALNAAHQTRAKRWIYAGAALGIVASIAGAMALQLLFPAISAGTNREILEGGVGILAVAMMLFIGAWLHSKSSIAGWKAFVDKQVAQALATGSLISMMLLSFLAVFREGAETILFYVGMLPRITTGDLLLGIVLALALLAVIAVLMNKGSMRFPMHIMFKTMTWLIYALGFKILGVSINALQLTNVLPTHIVSFAPNIPSIGLYPNWEGIGAQLIYLALIPVVAKLFQHKH